MVETTNGGVAPKRGIPGRRGVAAFLRTGFCSQALCRTLDREYGAPMIDEERASVPLAGGIMGNGYQCGMVWGSALAAGAQAYRLLGSGPRAQTKAIVAAQRIVKSFRAQNRTIECSEIAGFDLLSASTLQTAGYLLRGGPVRCFRMAAKYPTVAFDEIETALSEESGESTSVAEDGAPAAPVGCSALLAQKMCASDMHAVMTAGFAGGIGLSGSACGALGAAIWFAGLKSLEEGAEKIPYKPARATDLAERFPECTGGEFRRDKIVGRKFENVADHTVHVCDGGCSKIIETLAAK